jgi:chitin synthase
MDPRMRRSPSPGQPYQQGYQLEDNPYGQPSHLDYPTPNAPGLAPSPGVGRYASSDQLQLNAAVSFPCPPLLVPTRS